jgi:hypothetical protein
MKSPKVRYVMVTDGYEAEDLGGADAAAEALTEAASETEDGSDVRLECLKLAVAFAKSKDDKGPIAIAKQFLAFVLAQEPGAPTGEGKKPDGRTVP